MNVLTQQLISETMLSLSDRTEEAALNAVTALASCLTNPQVSYSVTYI